MAGDKQPKPPEEFKEQAWSSEEVTIAGGQDLPYEASFHPDWWIVQVSEAIASPIYVYRNPDTLTERMRLIGTGQRAFPGKKGQRRIILRNTALVSAKLEVIASVGYPPTQVVDPVTLSSPQTAEIQAQTRYELGLTNMPSPQQFIHPHIGEVVILYAGLGHSTAAGTVGKITAVTIGGVAATRLVECDSRTGSGNYGQYSSWWIARGVPEGNVSIVLTLENANADCLYCQAHSYVGGIRTGNVAAIPIPALPLANPPAYNIIGQEDASVIFCGLACMTGIPSETSGAPDWDPLHVLNSEWNGMWRRVGKGTHPFDFQSTLAMYFASTALEVLPI